MGPKPNGRISACLTFFPKSSVPRAIIVVISIYVVILTSRNNKLYQLGSVLFVNPITINEIECMLLDIVNRKSMSFVLQDVQCKKCQEIKRENLTKFCSCAGEFQLLQSSANLLQTLNIFHAVGRRFQMTLLTQTVFQLLQMNKS